MSPLALDLERIPDISLGTAALLIFGAIASLAVLRGLLRVLWGCVALSLSCLAAFFVWQHAPALSRDLFGREIPALSWGISIVTFLLAALLLRQLARLFFAPLRKPDKEVADKNRRSPVRWAFTLLLSLIPTALVWFAGATLLRHAGSVAEIRSFAESGQLPEHTAFLAQLKQRIEGAIPAGWFSSVDPLADDARLKLAKLISAAEDPPRAIPVLQEEQTRDLILADPELRRLAEEGRYSEILRDPRLDRLLENDNLREVLENTDL